MAKIKNGKPTWDVKPGSKEFRLANVDGRATVDVGQCKRFRNRLGPGWRAEKWGGRAFIEIAAHGVTVNGTQGAGKLKSDAKRGCDVYECECLRKVNGRNRAERHIVVPGSTQYEIHWDTLADVPDTGYVDLLLEFSGDLQWHKQPALTQQEIDEGNERPENVVNSYAVYGSQSGRILTPDGTEKVNYETGKFCHLYRSQLIDAKGNRCWIDQTAPLANPNRLRLYLNTAWLVDATFPVILDPTFGYTSVGAASRENASGRQYSRHGTPATSGTATSCSAYCRYSSGSAEITLGLYDDSSGPVNLLADTNGVATGVSEDWVSASLDAGVDVVASTKYWIAMNQSASIRLWYDSGTGNESYYGPGATYSSGNLTDPFGTPTGQTRIWSMYATYEETSAATPWLYARNRSFIFGGGLR